MTNVIIWIATQSHVNEAEQSAKSVAAQMPDVHRVLFSPDAHGKHFHFNVTLPGRIYSLWYQDFVSYMNFAFDTLAGYDKVLYLDTDTYMAHPVPEIFELLDYFDLASVIAPARQISYTVNPIPHCFSEFNTGVLAFRHNDAVRTLFDSWSYQYNRNSEQYGENDQAPLREALLTWPGRFWAMPIEYNCRFGFGGQAAGEIKILHGRSGDMAGLAQRINADTGIRGWRRGDFS